MDTLFKVGKGNSKTGPMLTVMTDQGTCPDSCPLKFSTDEKTGEKKDGPCYAKGVRMLTHWQKMRDAMSAQEFALLLKRKVAKGQLWRMATAGDMPGKCETVNEKEFNIIVKANEGRKGFTYSHKYNLAGNIVLFKKALKKGFVVNLSANNVEHADVLADQGLPVVCVLPMDATEKSYNTPQGRKIVTCPYALDKTKTCNVCGLCAKGDRSFIIGFPAHGTRKRTADKIACENI
jgi:ferredoxin